MSTFFPSVLVTYIQLLRQLLFPSVKLVTPELNNDDVDQVIIETSLMNGHPSSPPDELANVDAGLGDFSHLVIASGFHLQDGVVFRKELQSDASPPP